MERLIILGTGPHAHEMAEIVERVNMKALTWELLGYVTAGETNTVGTINGYPVLGSVEILRLYPDARIIPDNEWPRSLDIPRERLTSLIDPQSFVSRTAQIGIGSVIYPNCYVGLNAHIGDFVFCLSGCTINHDDRIADRAVFASGVTLAGSVIIESDCYLGQSCSVREYIKVGKGSLVGMGSVVIKDVPSNSVAVGNPARIIKANI